MSSAEKDSGTKSPSHSQDLIVTRVIGVLECLEKLCKSLRPSTVFGRTTSFTRHACLLKRFVSKQDFFKKKLVLPAVSEIVLVQ